ncbi:MAG: exodeoxyribonuclease VII large subunit [Propionibacterium sp.]|nr:exodeoxyribonuclease VII large subunit [Propionibacterium sp.]
MAMESSPEQPQSLARVVRAVKGWVERLGAIWVEAQVIEIRRRADASTQFLTLRDPFAEVSATVTCSRAVLDAAGPLTEGTTVTALVRPTVWSTTSRLSFECSELRPSGEGRLLAQIEQRKRLLQAEGLFDPARKKRLPVLPRAIGLVTGKDSAAERDVVTNIRLRWPGATILTRHTLVQGSSAAAEVIAAVASLDADPRVEVIIIARGGGSLEDLLPFSDEGLVRAVAACGTPVVSAIGHEPDTPILDLVADLRASTPTDAAKRVVPDVADELLALAQATRRMRGAVATRIEREQNWLDQVRSRPVLRDPTGGLDVHAERLTGLQARLAQAVDRRLEREQTSLTHAVQRVRAMSPKATLDRGYAILVDGAGTTVTSVHDVDPDDDLLAHLADGRLVIEVRDVEPDPVPIPVPPEER